MTDYQTYAKSDPRQSCYRKKRYQTEDHAKKVANRRSYENGLKGRDKLVAYACFECGGYHIGRPPGSSNRRE